MFGRFGCPSLLRLALIKVDIGNRQQGHQIMTILRCLADAETHRHRHAVAAAPGLGARFNALKYLADGSFIPLRQDSNKLIAAPATTFPSFTPSVRRLALLLFDACAQPVDESGFRADVEFDHPPVCSCKTPAFYRVFFSH